MKSIEDYIHDRLKELQAKKETLRKELEGIEVRVEELNNIIMKIANEPADMHEDDEPVFETTEEELAPPPSKKTKKTNKVVDDDPDPMLEAMNDLAAAQDGDMLDSELDMLAENFPPKP